MTNKNNTIEQEADNMRSAAKATTIPVNVKKIIASNGLVLMSTDLDDSLSGAFLSNEKVVVVNKNHSLFRKRFTIAHELGHFQLHKNEADKEFIDGIFKREKKEDQQTLTVERDANQFAAALLMPINEITREFQKLDLTSGDFINDLSQKFKVSRESMNFRLINLGLIDPQ